MPRAAVRPPARPTPSRIRQPRRAWRHTVVSTTQINLSWTGPRRHGHGLQCLSRHDRRRRETPRRSTPPLSPAPPTATRRPARARRITTPSRRSTPRATVQPPARPTPLIQTYSWTGGAGVWTVGLGGTFAWDNGGNWQGGVGQCRGRDGRSRRGGGQRHGDDHAGRRANLSSLVFSPARAAAISLAAATAMGCNWPTAAAPPRFRSPAGPLRSTPRSYWATT